MRGLIIEPAMPKHRGADNGTSFLPQVIEPRRQVLDHELQLRRPRAFQV
jgi:hypothetical protein